MAFQFNKPKPKRSFRVAVYLFNRKHLMYALLLLVAVTSVLVYTQRDRVQSVIVSSGKERVVHLVTGEFSSTLPDGKKIEAYRWDGGTIYTKKGETIKLSIYGVSGESHPFYIEGTSIKGEVKKGQETVVTFHAEKEGVYRLICLAHPDIAHNGPMIAYIVVD